MVLLTGRLACARRSRVSSHGHVVRGGEAWAPEGPARPVRPLAGLGAFAQGARQCLANALGSPLAGPSAARPMPPLKHFRAVHGDEVRASESPARPVRPLAGLGAFAQGARQCLANAPGSPLAGPSGECEPAIGRFASIRPQPQPSSRQRRRRIAAAIIAMPTAAPIHNSSVPKAAQLLVKSIALYRSCGPLISTA